MDHFEVIAQHSPTLINYNGLDAVTKFLFSEYNDYIFDSS